MNGTLQRELRVLEMLTTFYAAAGNAPDTDAGLALMAKFLSARAEPEAINSALERCLLECRYPIRLPDILVRIPGTEAADVDAEKRLAWETVEKFVRKFVGNDIHGNYGPEFGWFGPQRNSHGEIVRSATYPELPQRILETVRRTGGWRAYALMTDADFPHQQKRFFEEYEAWSKIQRIGDRERQFLDTPRMQQLVASKAMEPAAPDPVRAPIAPAEPISPAKARIMKAIEKARSSR